MRVILTAAVIGVFVMLLVVLLVNAVILWPMAVLPVIAAIAAAAAYALLREMEARP